MKYYLSISENHYDEIRNHLYPGDSKEAVAIALCGRLETDNIIKLLIYQIIPLPHEICKVREEGLLNWPTEYLLPYLEKANKGDFSILKIHSHPKGGKFFSYLDDRADGDLFPSLFGWIDNAPIHASCIMLPDGEIFGRVFDENSEMYRIEKVSIISDDIQVWSEKTDDTSSKGFELRNIQAFGEGTINALKQMKVSVIGCSGTGSPLIEQLVRLGVGELIIVDPDTIEEKNLNRIINSTIKDALKKRKKVDVLKEAIDNIGLGTEVIAIGKDIYSDISIVKQIAESDFIFGCVDSIDARHLLNQIASFFIIPYIDIGVSLRADGKGGVSNISGVMNYVKPGGSSLRTRHLFTDEELRAALMEKFAPESYEALKKEKYIKGVQVESPAVISVNTQMAAIAANEFLARVHHFREDEIKDFAIIRMDILNGYIQNEPDGEPDIYLLKYIGRGDNIVPFLNMMEFST